MPPGGPGRPALSISTKCPTLSLRLHPPSSSQYARRVPGPGIFDFLYGILLQPLVHLVRYTWGASPLTEEKRARSVGMPALGPQHTGSGDVSEERADPQSLHACLSGWSLTYAMINNLSSLRTGESLLPKPGWCQLHLQRPCGTLGGLREDSLLPQSSMSLSVLP